MLFIISYGGRTLPESKPVVWENEKSTSSLSLTYSISNDSMDHVYSSMDHIYSWFLHAYKYLVLLFPRNSINALHPHSNYVINCCQLISNFSVYKRRPDKLKLNERDNVTTAATA